MKIIIAISLFCLVSCNNQENINPSKTENMESNSNGVIDFSAQKLLAEGSFKSDAHATSGVSKIYEDKDGIKTLVLEGLKSDPGPDLRLYIAVDTKANDFIEISTKVENGNKFYKLPAKVDISKQKYILIWCKQFSVLFGHSELK